MNCFISRIIFPSHFQETLSCRQFLRWFPFLKKVWHPPVTILVDTDTDVVLLYVGYVIDIRYSIVCCLIVYRISGLLLVPRRHVWVTLHVCPVYAVVLRLFQKLLDELCLCHVILCLHGRIEHVQQGVHEVTPAPIAHG